MLLSGRTAIVVGASSGIGLATSREAANRGAHVVMVSRSAEKLEQASQGIAGQPAVFPVDMLDGAGLASAFADFARVDYVVLTAVADELARRAPIDQLSDDQIERSFDKMRGYVRILRILAPKLSADGAIVLLCGASAARAPGPGFALLSAESSAIVGLGRALAAELAPIRVNVLMAGLVDTPIHHAKREQTKSWAETSLPARRFGQPADIADAILTLLTNPYTTGQTLVVDGGLSLM
ncbi:SDR family oxidoreductase [Mesorhizobium sp.]|uniref:SDR family NAD(P)-dependent oxidoreductase n=1 Tax=Mesorhizobium sp. TaxID=1871066 RepID=UPI000FEA2872|nr:SDR family oxidoreductase [Mesorhizobium sp.]RWP58225.1 MAG: SDR family oxidoreductase [Mesorhizobium sp.]